LLGADLDRNWGSRSGRRRWAAAAAGALAPANLRPGKRNGRRGELSGGLGGRLGGLSRKGRGAVWSSTRPPMGHHNSPGLGSDRSSRRLKYLAVLPSRLRLEQRGRCPDRGQQRRTRRGQCGRAGARVPRRDTRRRGLPRSSACVPTSRRHVA
jgi:hypothetical protein